MLGWMLRRGDDAPDAVGDGDTTQIDQPDTPAPVFAARAFKSAIFGTPARPSDQPETRSMMDQDQDSKTPQRPQGILLTPGTGTSRRKRVSFGQDVGKKTNGRFVAKTTEAPQRSRLNEALENASQEEAKSVVQKPATRRVRDDESDDEWEEADDEDVCQDITVDLNEPHSQSGKYWKGEFEKYHEDAKAEMEKLLKYKQLAKSYAKQKDAEAIQLAEMLKDEQQKVITMESQIAEGASKMVSKRGNRSEDTSPELLSTLTKQTALAVQYRTRVQELEDQLEDFLRDREDDADAEAKGRRRRLLTSPRTQKTLLDTQRELRRARNQVKELGELRDQVSTLKSQLRSAEKRATRVEMEGKSESEAPPEGSRAQELRAQLRDVKEDSRKKDEELRALKKEFEVFRQDTKAREEDTKGVLERAHNKISDLKKEIRTLKASSSEPAARPKSWHPQTEVDLLHDPALNTVTNGVVRRSFDLKDLEDESVEIRVPSASTRTLREKFHDDALAKAAQSDLGARPTSMTFDRERPNLEPPRWQPFVPRSPRNRAYLGEELTNRIQNGGATSAASKLKEIEAPDLPSLAKSIARSSHSLPTDKGEANVDLLQDRFARLGGPDLNDGAVAGNIAKNPVDEIQDEIVELERRLQDARERLKAARPPQPSRDPGRDSPTIAAHLAASTHFLLLLSDSALPLGSFAFSSGLESYLAHNRRGATFSSFLPSSLSSVAATTLPFALAAHRDPSKLADLDDQLDAAIVCTVGRRASVAQGRALLGIWERSFRSGMPPEVDGAVLRDFAALLRAESKQDVPLASAHLAPLFGAICAIVGLGLRQTAYVFMLSHVKALISAAVRASVFGPYQAQKVLAGQLVQGLIDDMIDREWATPVEEAGQTVPVMDLWIGRHETLYSRIFNS
ncbi:spindle pole body formation-associated protein-domain-containing protein [Dactylonectria estremocensis]|uniref:Spindle pole body formation-associated protein-domain-containing protein n=1 Tax=Dactylonectria estremocensis TaxID=1079267 RepID=A0A9P9J5R2_9HYPO|nr:spindle pole body formation-associated protein-domain-containing protein [Dactylonectria estremocensis]